MHWSNDAMVSMDRCGLAGIEVSKPSIVQKSDTFSYLAAAWESLQEMLAIGGLDVTHLTKC